MIHDFCSTIKNPEEEPTQSFGAARNTRGTGPDDIMYKSIVTENKVWCFELLYHNNYNNFQNNADTNMKQLNNNS